MNNLITIKMSPFDKTIQPYQQILIRRISYFSGIPYQNITDLINEYPDTPYIYKYE